MTDRIKALTVLLEPDVREDDCREIIRAISMIRRVARVETHVADLDHWAAVQMARITLQKQLWDVLKP